MKKNCEIIYNGTKKNKVNEETIVKVIDKCFEVEGLKHVHLYVSITLTTPEEIRKINKKFRNIDKETDVLSFPMFEKIELKKIIAGKEINAEEDILGDIIISIHKVEEQAEEYGHGFDRELSYMVVHGFYHLMGYDHIKENEKKEMREKEEKILTILNINRN